jgi:magnesium transporter
VAGSGTGNLLEALREEGISGDQLKELVRQIHPIDLAALLEDLSVVERAELFGMIDPTQALEVALRMHVIPLSATLRRIDPVRASEILNHMAPERVSRIVARFNAKDRARLMEHLKQTNRMTFEQMEQFPPKSAGHVMRHKFARALDTWTFQQAKQALGEIRDRALNFLIIVDAGDRLVGMVYLQDLLSARPEDPVRSAMRADFDTADPYESQEAVAQRMMRSQVPTMPVVDRNRRILGVVTLQDALHILQHEASEDIHRFAGTNVVDSLHTPALSRFRYRLPWLLLTLAGELAIAVVIATVFRSTLERAAILAAFMPAIMATGGNVGLQTTTIVVRGLGMGTIREAQILRVILAELRVGALLAACCGVLAGVAAGLIEAAHPDAMKVALAVTLAMMSATLATSFSGSLVPLVLNRMKLDPAAACGPFVTMCNDLFGAVVYLSIAMMMDFSTA